MSNLDELEFVPLAENFDVVGASPPHTPHVDTGYVHHAKIFTL